MEYRIGDVSKMLHLSDQMIRYYEKCGVIHPERSGDGRYRVYTEMDIFLLFEAMKYKEWDVSIPEISSLITNEYYDALNTRLKEYEKKLTEEIDYKNIMRQRVMRVRRKLKISRYNTGKIYAEIMPERDLFYLGESDQDEYSMENMDPDMSSLIYSPQYISFFDPRAEYDGDHGTWWYSIDSDLLEQLHLPVYGRHVHQEEQTVLTTFIDMGEPGSFTADRYSILMEYAEQNHYAVTGRVSGTLVGRGNEGGRFRRMMQMVLPIESL